MPEIVGGLPATTVSVPLPVDFLLVPLLTVTTMPLILPTSLACGVPERRPVDESKVAQRGILLMLNLSALPRGSLAFGR